MPEYLTPEQLKTLEVRFNEIKKEWLELMTKARIEMKKGTELTNPSVQIIARLWQYCLKYLIRGDQEIYDSLIRKYQREGVEWEQSPYQKKSLLCLGLEE